MISGAVCVRKRAVTYGCVYKLWQNILLNVLLGSGVGTTNIYECAWD